MREAFATLFDRLTLKPSIALSIDGDRVKGAIMAKKIDGYIGLQVPAGSAKPFPANRPSFGSARREHHGILQGVQCRDRRHGKGHADPDQDHVFMRDKSFTFIMKAPPATYPDQEGAGPEVGFERARQDRRWQDHARAARRSRDDEDGRSERERHGRGNQRSSKARLRAMGLEVVEG